MTTFQPGDVVSPEVLASREDRAKRRRLRDEEDARAIAHAKKRPVSDAERAHLRQLMSDTPGFGVSDE